MSGLSEFTVELDIYSGPYEWLLALILRDELEIFEIPLGELVSLYRKNYPEGLLERDSSFTDSAASLVLLKSNSLSPALEEEEETAEEPLASPEELAERLRRYLMARRGAEEIERAFDRNSGSYTTAHSLHPSTGGMKVDRKRLLYSARRAFSRNAEPSTRHMGRITVTLQELADLIKSSLFSGPLKLDDILGEMDRLHSAVGFAAAVSMASRGEIGISQGEHLGPITLKSNP